MTKVLFICTGNVCRSLFAERLLDKLARERGVDVEVKSCGIAAQGYYQPPEPIWTELAKLGVEKRAHTPQLVSRALLSWADVALTMTHAQRRAVLDMFPEFTPKVHLFRQWAGLGEDDVEDPMGQADAVYMRSCSAVAESVKAALEKALFNSIGHENYGGHDRD